MQPTPFARRIAINSVDAGLRQTSSSAMIISRATPAALWRPRKMLLQITTNSSFLRKYRAAIPLRKRYVVERMEHAMTLSVPLGVDARRQELVRGQVSHRSAAW